LVLAPLAAWVLCGISLSTTADSAEPAQSASQPASSATEYRIQSSDALQITVFQEPDLTQKAKVSPAGTISYPLLGSVQLSGLTIAEAEKKLTELLGKDYLVNPRVTVTLESNSARRVMLFGQVKSPGSLEVPAEESLTLLQAIAKSGGFTDIAATDRVTIARSENGKERKIVVNASAIMKGGDRSKDIELKPGDVVTVPETIF
jgi:polysaccharide export outer membrane protein